jgi:hypothetical protein
MAWRYDQSPGSDVTLLALYDAVVAAEEFDLAEQAKRDVLWAEVGLAYGLGTDELAAAIDELGDDESADAGERLRMTQVVGLVEHLLGGHPIAER